MGQLPEALEQTHDGVELKVTIALPGPTHACVQPSLHLYWVAPVLCPMATRSSRGTLQHGCCDNACVNMNLPELGLGATWPRMHKLRLGLCRDPVAESDRFPLAATAMTWLTLLTRHAKLCASLLLVSKRRLADWSDRFPLATTAMTWPTRLTWLTRLTWQRARQ